MGGMISILVMLTVSLGILYLLARLLAKHYQINHKEYTSLRDGMPKLINRVYREAERWPIYSRPVLYDRIDHKAQVEFSQVHRAIDEAGELVSEIDEIDLPSYPTALPAFLAIRENAQTVVQSSLFLILVTNFAQKILEILRQIRMVNVYLGEETAAKVSVKNSLDKMKEDWRSAQEELATQTWANANIDHISWILLTTQQCIETAEERIKLKSGDGLEYAIAYIYSRIGNASLDYYRVYAAGMHENKHYELDEFGGFIKSSHAFLQAILSNENFNNLLVNDLNNWRKLRSADEQLDEFPGRLRAAEESLDLFRTERDTFEALERQLAPLDMDHEIGETRKIETECTYYWYSYQERPAFWQTIIGPAKPPTDSLSQLKSELISSLTPALKASTIKQSSLEGLIDQLDNFFVKLVAAKRDLEKLRTELNRHKAAQTEVRLWMDRTGGKAGTAVNDLERILQDTSPDIKETAFRLVQLYKTYETRANVVRGADFPDLLSKVQEYSGQASACLRSHEELLVKLEVDCSRSVQSVRTALTEISHILSLTPTIEDGMGNQFALLEKNGRQLVGQFNPAGGYTSFNKYLEITRAWQNDANRYLEPARAAIKAFTDTRALAVAQLRAAQTEIDQVRNNLQFKWALIASSILPEIEKTQSKMNSELRDWTRHDGRNWADMNLRAATEYCERIIRRCEQVLNELNESISTINKEQRKWQEKEVAIRRIAVKNLYKISEQDRADVLVLCDIAKAAETLEEVEITLKRAELMVTNAATPREKREAQISITQYTNSGSGTFIAGSVSTEGGDFVGRDKRSSSGSVS